jgi:hypothetical protein
MAKMFAILLLVFSISQAQDKIPLRFPLGLTPGISQDSASQILAKKGAIRGQEDKFMKERDMQHWFYDMAFGSAPIVSLEIEFYENKLIAVWLRSQKAIDGSAQLELIRQAREFLHKTYKGLTLYDDFSSFSEYSDFRSEAILCYRNANIDCVIGSMDNVVYGRVIYIWFIDNIMNKKKSLHEEEIRQQKEEKSKKDL